MQVTNWRTHFIYSSFLTIEHLAIVSRVLLFQEGLQHCRPGRLINNLSTETSCFCGFCCSRGSLCDFKGVVVSPGLEEKRTFKISLKRKALEFKDEGTPMRAWFPTQPAQNSSYESLVVSSLSNNELHQLGLTFFPKGVGFKVVKWLSTNKLKAMEPSSGMCLGGRQQQFPSSVGG